MHPQLTAIPLKKIANSVVLYICFAILLLLPILGFAQSAEIRGFVYDKNSGEPIPFANVELEGTNYGTSSDIDGLYGISGIPAGNYNLMATYVGFDTTIVALQLRAGEIANQKIYLSETQLTLGVVEIDAAKEEQRTEVRTSAVKISAQDIEKLPSVGGEPDLAQYLQVIPGVVLTGDQGGQFYVRGGSPIETKVMMDGMTIYNPFHSIGLFSVFETSLIRNVDVLTGGFGAEYSGRTSAIIDLTTKDGNKTRQSGLVAANTFLAKAVLEGPIAKLKPDGDGSSASYVLSTKYSYLDKSADIFYDYLGNETTNEDGSQIQEGLPYNFFDIYGKVNISLDNGSSISFSGFNFTDNARFRASDYEWNSYGVGTKFLIVPGSSRAIIDGYLSYSQYDIQLTESDGRPRLSEIGGFNGGVNFTYFLPKSSQLKYGIEVSGFSTNFEFFNGLGYKYEAKQNTTEMGGFVKYKGIAGKLIWEPSIRTTYYASLPTFAFEPRLGLKYNINTNVRLKAATGFYTQNFLSTKSDRDVVNLFSGYINSPDLTLRDVDNEVVKNNLQTATHFVGGIEVDLTNTLSANLEGYYKDFGQVININRNKSKASDPDYIVENGEAYGSDLLLKYKTRQWFIWTTYSLTFVNRNTQLRNEVVTYAPHFDRRHNLNFLVAYSFGNNNSWEASLRWNYGSGFPFTLTQGFYEEVPFSGGIDADYLEGNGDLGIIYDDVLNEGRLSEYHRLDASLKKTILLGLNSKLNLNASLTNAYDRENLFYFDRVRYERINQLPILPSFGLSLEF